MGRQIPMDPNIVRNPAVSDQALCLEAARKRGVTIAEHVAARAHPWTEIHLLEATGQCLGVCSTWMAMLQMLRELTPIHRRKLIARGKPCPRHPYVMPVERGDEGCADTRLADDQREEER